MKKCPSCYAIMKETTIPAEVPQMQRGPANGPVEVVPVKVRYECSQCGHTEEAFAK